MWVRFTDAFSWKPKPMVTIDYEAGTIQNVTRACGEDAIAKGKAEAHEPEKKAGEGQGDV